MFVSNSGVLYHDHSWPSDSFELYRGELTGNNRLLHYVSLYLKDELCLPELLTMQCRIMLEHQLNSNLRYDTHDVYIPREKLI